MVPTKQCYNARGDIRDETKPLNLSLAKMRKDVAEILKLVSCLFVETYITLVFHLLNSLECYFYF